NREYENAGKTRRNFLFQAEDGIRDFHVTGVQTCALPISSSPRTASTVRTAPSATAIAATTRRGSSIMGIPSAAAAPPSTSRPRQIGRASCRERVENSAQDARAAEE